MPGHAIRVMATGKVFSDVELDRLRPLLSFYGKMSWVNSYVLEPRLLVAEGIPESALGIILEDLQGIIHTPSALSF